MPDAQRPLQEGVRSVNLGTPGAVGPFHLLELCGINCSTWVKWYHMVLSGVNSWIKTAPGQEDEPGAE